jgi:hypothetical protein
MAYASLSPNVSDRIQPLIPALKSNWLIAHVITCFVGYGAFAVAFGVSIMYLLKAGQDQGDGGLVGRFPSTSVLDELTHQLVMFGFLFLCAGIITGAVSTIPPGVATGAGTRRKHGRSSPGFVYASLLHARLMRGSGRRIAYLSIIGFGAVLFTYFGVNLLPGLHSYQSMHNDFVRSPRRCAHLRGAAALSTPRREICAPELALPTKSSIRMRAMDRRWGGLQAAPMVRFP